MDLRYFLIFALASAAAASTGMLFKPGVWYEQLKKPEWTPQNWMFPVAWTTLYLFSSIAAARVAVLSGAGLALAFWAMQIAFNTLWTPVFFGAHRMGAALIAMAGLWVGVLGMLVSFWTLDLWSGLLIAPYLVWVTVAAALNLWIWRHNRDAGVA